MDLREYIPIWDRLSQTQQDRLLECLTEHKVPKGTVIHHGAGDCSGLHLIQSGQLRAYMLSDEGREITLYRLFERDICLFSAPCIMRSIQFDLIIETEKDTVLWMLPADVYRSVMEESAALSNYTNELMATRFSDVMWLMEQIMWKSLDKRLAAFLLEEISIEEKEKLSITHEAIANHLGSHREVITRMLKYFQNEGMVSLSRGCVEVTGKEKLQALTGE